MKKTPSYGSSWDRLSKQFKKHGSGVPEDSSQLRELALGDIHEMRAVFQHRDQENWVVQRHIDGLTSALRRERRNGDDVLEARLEPIEVFAVAGRWYVLDGHCRSAAYRKVGLGPQALVPVRAFGGTLREALERSMGANTRDKLPLTKREKLEAAWKLVLANSEGHQSARAIGRLVGVSPSTVTKMQTQLDQGPWTRDPAKVTWAEVKAERAGTREYDPEWLNAQKEKLVRRLRKHFGPFPDRNADIFVDALFEAYPRVEEWIEQEIQARVEEDPDGDS